MIVRRLASPALAALAVLCALASPAGAQSTEQVKPYILLILDISGSMDTATGFGAPSCGGVDTRFDHAKCAIQKLVDTHGDVVFALARFRKATSGSCGACGGGSIDCSACNEATGSGCTATMRSPDRFELLVPLLEDNLDDVRSWVDFSCGACTFDPALDPELSNAGWTPIGGSLRGAQRYFQGSDPFYATDLAPIYGTAAGDPIRNDPYKDVFVDGAQCRPYIVISLTDGEETCEEFDPGTLGAASSLLTTDVDGLSYRIEVKPIGFGMTPPATQIEELARSGGNPGDGAGGSFEGYYASDETSLSIAFNQIIADSILVEVCNGIDDDCDGEIDEGYQLYCDLDGVLGPPTATANLCTNPGDDCDGVDDNCYMGVADEPRNACGTCGPTPAEICNGVDDDCDGFIDEGGVCGGCTPEPEICDGKDNDCDGRFDEEITRPCGSDIGVCTPGTQQCIEQPMEAPSGTWDVCTGVGPTGELCNGLDDDCDGIVDGFAEECYEFPDGCVIGVGCDGICQTGTRVCAAGAWGSCFGDVGPGTEICNGLDDDCDGEVDEGNPGGGIPCGSACGVGVTECVMGEIVCTGGSGGEPEVCNGLDDDCDGLVDEDLGPMGPCDEDSLCVPGELQCVAGAWQCVGGVPPTPEVCDCEDNDCDGTTDEDVDCGAGACLDGPYCRCAQPCAEDEFPCPLGDKCITWDGDGNRYCVPDPCFGVTCEPTGGGELTVCVDGECVPVCDTLSCGSGFACRPDSGLCVSDDCIGFPERCSAGELCVAGECVVDLCAGVECPRPDQFCRDGECVGSCADVDCPGGQVCQGGSCVDDPCAGVSCPRDQVCDPASGECVDDQCGSTQCPAGEVCDPPTGDCIQDPCLGVECPGEQVCVAGDCFDPDDLLPDAGPVDHDYVAPGGGGGCACDTGGGRGGGDPGGGGLLLFGLAGLAILRRRAR